ncbi:L-lactate MFS transporter [Tessaracoccus sp.]|uniref:L-lactate MFS transporter n=1 Tax=Tessaracoccus sp. TaxID=1971211 RepID=UPI00261BD870|nr:OFA family MFS transporter [Tessaracoccus sp.]
MRWLALVGGVLVQLVIGGVYAWSLFGRALQSPDAMGLGHVEATVPFELAIGLIFVGASVGGRLQDRSSPRMVALIGCAVYGVGVMLASFAREASDLWLLVLGYGVVGGFGLGMAYIVPIALLQRWFPRHRAIVTGLAVGGFGFGATVTSPMAQWLMARTPTEPTAAFLPLGAGYLVFGLLGAALLSSPPMERETSGSDGSAGASEPSGLTVAQALRTPQWYLLAGTLAVAVAAGIALISMMAAAAVDVAGLDAAGAATAVGLLALCNGGGRIVWAAVAQRLGQLPVLMVILALEGAALLFLPHTSGAWFLALAAVVYLCYGGAFGALPSAAGAAFGMRHAGAIYGLMLIGWSASGVVGPLLASALVGDAGNYRLAFSVLGALAVVGVALPLTCRRIGLTATAPTR